MRGRIVCILFAALLSIVFSAKAQEGKTVKDSVNKSSAEVPDTCVQFIEGTVRDYYTQNPVKGAIVKAWYKGQSARTAAKTNGNGYYKIKVAEPTAFDSLAASEATFGWTTLRGRITVNCGMAVKLPLIELKEMSAGCIGMGRTIIFEENKPVNTNPEETGGKKKRRKNR